MSTWDNTEAQAAISSRWSALTGLRNHTYSLHLSSHCWSEHFFKIQGCPRGWCLIIQSSITVCIKFGATLPLPHSQQVLTTVCCELYWTPDAISRIFHKYSCVAFVTYALKFCACFHSMLPLSLSLFHYPNALVFLINQLLFTQCISNLFCNCFMIFCLLASCTCCSVNRRYQSKDWSQPILCKYSSIWVLLLNMCKELKGTW